jgi:hypothetical protein
MLNEESLMPVELDLVRSMFNKNVYYDGLTSHQALVHPYCRDYSYLEVTWLLFLIQPLELASELQRLPEAVRLHELHGHRPACPGLPQIQGPVPPLSLPKGLSLGGAGLPDPGMRLTAPLTAVLHPAQLRRRPAVIREGLPGDAQKVQG